MAWFSDLDISLSRIGLGAGPLSQWLYAGLAKAGFAVELIEMPCARWVQGYADPDRQEGRTWSCAADAARLVSASSPRFSLGKSLPAQEVRAMLTARKLVQTKLHDVEMSVRGILRG